MGRDLDSGLGLDERPRVAAPEQSEPTIERNLVHPRGMDDCHRSIHHMEHNDVRHANALPQTWLVRQVRVEHRRTYTVFADGLGGFGVGCGRSSIGRIEAKVHHDFLCGRRRRPLSEANQMPGIVPRAGSSGIVVVTTCKLDA